MLFFALPCSVKSVAPVTPICWAALIKAGDAFAFWQRSLLGIPWEVGPSPPILPLSHVLGGRDGPGGDPHLPARHTRAVRGPPELCAQRVLARRRGAEETS